MRGEGGCLGSACFWVEADCEQVKTSADPWVAHRDDIGMQFILAKPAELK